jgi:hypothetical protein
VAVQAEVEGPDRRALARKMADRLRELDAEALRGAVTAVPAPVAKTRIAAKVRAKAGAVPTAASVAVPSPRPTATAPQAASSTATRTATAHSTPNSTTTRTANSTPAPTAAATPDLDRAVLAELRTALRGRTPAELADSIAAPADAVQGAIRALAAQGVVVARGAKIYAA